MLCLLERGLMTYMIAKVSHNDNIVSTSNPFGSSGFRLLSILSFKLSPLITLLKFQANTQIFKELQLVRNNKVLLYADDILPSLLMLARKAMVKWIGKDHHYISMWKSQRL